MSPPGPRSVPQNAFVTSGAQGIPTGLTMAPEPHADMTSGSEIHATAPHDPDSPGSVVRLTLEGARAAPSKMPVPLPPAWLSSPASCVWTATSEIRLSGKPNVSVSVFFPCPFHPPAPKQQGDPLDEERTCLLLFHDLVLRASTLQLS